MELEALAQIRARLAHPNLLPFHGLLHGGPDTWAYDTCGYAPINFHQLLLADSLDTSLALLTHVASLLVSFADSGIVHGGLCFEALFATPTLSSWRILHASAALNAHVLPAYPFAAPEVFRHDLRLTPAADVFSFGLLLWALWAHDLPFRSPTSSTGFIDRSLAWNTLPELPSSAPPLILALLRETLVLVPSQRASPERVLGYLALISASAAGDPRSLLKALSSSSSHIPFLTWRPELASPSQLYRILPPVSLVRPGSGLLFHASPFVDAAMDAASRVFIAYTDGYILAARVPSSSRSTPSVSILWSTKVPASPTCITTAPLNPDAASSSSSSTAVSAGAVLVGTAVGGIVVLDPDSGALIAARSSPPRCISSPSPVTRISYVPDASEHTFVVFYASGEIAVAPSSSSHPLSRASEWRPLMFPEGLGPFQNALSVFVPGDLVFMISPTHGSPLVVAHTSSLSLPLILTALVPETAVPTTLNVHPFKGPHEYLVVIGLDSGAMVSVLVRSSGDVASVSTFPMHEMAVLGPGPEYTPLPPKSQGVSVAAFSPGGHSLFVGSVAGKVVGYSLLSGGDPETRFHGHVGKVTHMVVSRDGAASLLYTAGVDGTVRAWDSENGDPIHVFGTLGAPVTALHTLSTSSLVLALGTHGNGLLWSTLPLQAMVTLYRSQPERYGPGRSLPNPAAIPESAPTLPFRASHVVVTDPQDLQRVIRSLSLPAQLSAEHMVEDALLPLARSLASIPFATVRSSRGLSMKGVYVACRDLDGLVTSLSKLRSIVHPALCPLMAYSLGDASPSFGYALHTSPEVGRRRGVWVWYGHEPEEEVLSLSGLARLSSFQARLWVALDLALGLAAVHMAGFVHGSLCPSFVYLVGEQDRIHGRVVLPPQALLSRGSSKAHVWIKHGLLLTHAADGERATMLGEHATLEMDLELEATAESREVPDEALVEPLLYAPPEGVRNPCCAGDMYTFGLLVCEILSGDSPLLRGDSDRTHNRFARPRPDPKWPTPLRKLVVECLTVDPSTRPSIGRAVAALVSAIKVDTSLMSAVETAVLHDHDAIAVDALDVHIPDPDPVPVLLPGRHLFGVASLHAVAVKTGTYVVSLSVDGGVNVWMLPLAHPGSGRLRPRDARLIHTVQVGVPGVGNAVILCSLPHMSPGQAFWSSSRAPAERVEPEWESATVESGDDKDLVVLACSLGSDTITGRSALLAPHNPLFTIEGAHPQGVSKMVLLSPSVLASAGVGEDNIKLWSLSSLLLMRGLWLPELDGGDGCVVDMTVGPRDALWALTSTGDLVVWADPGSSTSVVTVLSDGAMSSALPLPDGPSRVEVYSLTDEYDLVLVWDGRMGVLDVFRVRVGEDGSVGDGAELEVVFEETQVMMAPLSLGSGIPMFPASVLLSERGHVVSIAVAVSVLNTLLRDELFAEHGGVLDESSVSFAFSPQKAFLPSPVRASPPRVETLPPGGILHIWDVCAPVPRVVTLIDAHPDLLTDVTRVPGTPTVVTASADGTVCAWDAISGSSLSTLLVFDSRVFPTSLEVVGAGRLLVGGSDGDVYCVDLVAGLAKAVV